MDAIMVWGRVARRVRCRPGAFHVLHARRMQRWEPDMFRACGIMPAVTGCSSQPPSIILVIHVASELLTLTIRLLSLKYGRLPRVLIR